MRLPLPPPSQRQLPKHEPQDDREWALQLLAEHEELVEAVTRRSSSDFAPRARRADDLGEELAVAFARCEHAPPSLVATLSPLLVPRIDALAPRLRRRLARSRVELPLGRLRETDPTCLRRNARRPGRTLIEKAGPKQQLTGIRRVQRFDTTENRVLVATARRLARDTGEMLRSIPPMARQEDRAAVLRQLARSCEDLLARPELEDVGPPRPGERPSNALLGDANYRAIYRAWRLLRAEEARFQSRWNSLDRAWVEMVLLAAWAELDGRSDMEPLPSWVASSDEPKDGSRVHSGGSVRRWLQHGSAPRLLSLYDDGMALRLVSAAPDAAPETLSQHRPKLTFPARRVEAQEVAKQFLSVVGEGPRTLRVAPREWLDPGIDLTGPLGHVAGDGATGVLGPSAWARLDNPDGEPLELFDRSATWCDRVEAAALSPAAMGARVAALAPVGTAAVVVPDQWDDLALAELRRSAGRCWAVWRPVALALAVAAEGPAWLPRQAIDADVDVIVVVEGVDGVEIARLQAAWDLHEEGLPGLVWRRRHPAEHVPRELESSARGRWLRGDLLEVQNERLVTDPQVGGTVDLAALRALVAHEEGTVALVLASDGTVEAITEMLPRIVHRAQREALAHGARVFLERHAEHLPTWVDELPGLEVRAKVGRALDWERLWRERRLVRPGEHVEARSDVHLELPPGQSRVPVPLRRADRNLRYSLVVEGAPLPLERAARVAVHLSLTYGMDAISGELRPVGADVGRFRGLRFTLAPAEEEALVAGPLGPPPFPTVIPVAGAREALHRAAEALDPRARRKKGTHAEPSAVARGLRDFLGEPTWSLDRAAVDELALVLDWYLGLTHIKKAGRPPKGSSRDQEELLRCRGRLGVATDDFRRELARRLVQPDDVVVEASALSTERPDATWEALLEVPVSTGHKASVWAQGVFTTLRWHPDLAPSLGPEGVERVAGRVVELLRLAELDGHKGAFARLCAVVVWLCGARREGFAQLDDPGIPALRGELLRLRGTLDDRMRDHVERGLLFSDTRPIDSALAHLEGRYDALSEVL